MELRAHRVSDVTGMRVVSTHPQREWMNGTLIPHREDEEPKGRGFANRCLPMLMANQIGWEIQTTVAYTFNTLPNGHHNSVSVGEWPAAGPTNNFAENIVTWPIPWVFESPEGWDLLIIAPPNHILPVGVTVLSGLVETDHAHQTFTLNWKLPPLSGVYVPENTPIATIIPYPTANVEGWNLVEDDEVPERFDEFILRRSESIDRNGPEFGRWDKDYWDEAKRRKLKKDS